MPKNNEKEANLAQERSIFDSETLMLVVTTTSEVMNFITWYLDTQCLNHMICNKKLLTEFDPSKRTKVKLVETIQ